MSDKQLETEFVSIMGQEFPDISPYRLSFALNEIMRLSRRHHTICENYCNRELTDNEQIAYGYDPKTDDSIAPGDKLWPRTIEGKLEKINEEIFDKRLAFKLQGDPRGATVKIVVPSGRTNDWGKEGIIVPGS